MRLWYWRKSTDERRAWIARRDRERVRRVDSLAGKMARNPAQTRAGRALREAVHRGRIVKQPCEVCGATVVQAHHDDYGKPLDVRWLCVEHHTALHHPYIAKEVEAATF